MSFNFKNEKLQQAIEFVQQHPNKFTIRELAEQFNVTYDAMCNGIRRAKQFYPIDIVPDIERKKYKPKSERVFDLVTTPPNTERVLIIGDLHEPFTLDGYREFCIDLHKQYKCTHTIFIGDIVDNHAVSYHESDPEGMSAGAELDEAIDNIAKWYEAFPKADVILGNHDVLIMRKAFTGGIPRRWILNYQDMFNVPGWNFTERAVYDNVQYIHGMGGTARARSKKDLMSTVQGHLHTQAYTEYFVGANIKIFGSQVGCGVDRKAYAMAYAKDHGKPVVGAMVVLDNGKQPINFLMNI